MANLQRYSISLTYECNARCQGCNRFLDVWEWKNSDILLADIKEGHERLKRAGVEVVKVRLSGGEPILHPRFREAVELIYELWNAWPREHDKKRQWVTVFTNGVKPSPLEDDPKRWRHRISGTGAKKLSGFWPMMISPHDLRMKGTLGYDGRYCQRAMACGRLFDAFGFSFCIFAPAIGRVLGVDPYSSQPVTDGMFEICRHCPFSLGRLPAFKLFEKVKAGKMRYPTRTYRKALKYLKEPMQFRRFLDRE